MPRRTNAFQELVTLIELQLAPTGARVSPSALVGDPPREVDILIRVPAGGHDVLIGVECTDRRRVATVEWVEQILGKHQALAIHKTVLVSSAGFSEAATNLARRSGAETFTLSTALAIQWSSFELTVVIPEVLEAVHVEFESETYPSHIDFDNADYHVAGKPVEPLRDIVFKLLGSSRAVQELYSAARDTGSGSVSLVWVFEDGEYLVDEAGTRYPLVLVLAVLQGRIERQALPSRTGTYGRKQVEFGEGPVGVRMVAISGPAGTESVSSSLPAGMTPIGHEIDGVEYLVARRTNKDDERYERIFKEWVKKQLG